MYFSVLLCFITYAEVCVYGEKAVILQSELTKLMQKPEYKQNLKIT